MKRSLVKWLVVSAALGLVVPAVFYLTSKIPDDPSSRLKTFLSIPIFVLTSLGYPFAAIFSDFLGNLDSTARFYSILANILLYCLVGFSIFVWKRDREQRRVLPPSSLSKWLRISGILGLVLPIFDLLVWGFSDLILDRAGSMQQAVVHYLLPLIGFTQINWPTTLFMYMDDGIKWGLTFWFFIPLSILANVYLYIAMGSILWAIRRITIKMRTRLKT